jgi:hypothetical protein
MKGKLLFLALALATPALAQQAEEPKSIGLHAELDDNKTVSISQGALRVRLDRDEAPVATLFVDGKQALKLGAGLGASLAAGAHVRILSLDKSAAHPQVVFSRYTGGAHCCAEVYIAHFSGGRWSVLKTGRRDGEEGYSFIDADGDGNAEMIGVDNAFLYKFDSYAGSLAPTQIYNLRGGKLVEVTKEERFKPFLRAELARFEKDANENPDTWKTNGFLAGWVAQKALLGEQADAWQRMLKDRDPESDWGLGCEDEPKQKKPAECNDPKTRQELFPRVLRAFLVKNGYLAANDSATK